MSCAACSAHINKAVSQVEGVKEVNVNLLTNSMTVSYEDSATPEPKATRVSMFGDLWIKALTPDTKNFRLAMMIPKDKTRLKVPKANGYSPIIPSGQPKEGFMYPKEK